jgi:hypothetical protein
MQAEWNRIWEKKCLVSLYEQMPKKNLKWYLVACTNGYIIYQIWETGTWDHMAQTAYPSGQDATVFFIPPGQDATGDEGYQTVFYSRLYALEDAG